MSFVYNSVLGIVGGSDIMGGIDGEADFSSIFEKELEVSFHTSDGS